jgi:hypothetical protein
VHQAPYKELEQLLVEAGWSVQTRLVSDRANLYGERDTGAAVLVSYKRSADNTKWNSPTYYVLRSPEEAPGLRWIKVRRGGFGYFVDRGTTKGSGMRLMKVQPKNSKCKCPKNYFPARAVALATLFEVKIKRVFTRGATEESRVYWCPYDARRWHITSKQEYK